MEKQNQSINTELADYREKVRALKIEKATLRERPASSRTGLTKSRAELNSGLHERQKSGDNNSTQQQQQQSQKKCTCGHLNDAGRLFCGECGTKLPTVRSQLTADLRGSQNFQNLKVEQEKLLTVYIFFIYIYSIIIFLSIFFFLLIFLFLMSLLTILVSIGWTTTTINNIIK